MTNRYHLHKYDPTQSVIQHTKPVRATTSRLLEMADDGVISWKDIAEAALRWMSEDDVAEMAKANEFFPEEEEDEEDED